MLCRRPSPAARSCKSATPACSASACRRCSSEHACQAQTQTRTPKSVIIVFLTGAPSHLDTFDMKPDAPGRDSRRVSAHRTRASPGLHVCEHLPRLAARADKYAVVRSLSHRENNHLVATHHVLTGHQQPGAFFDKVASRDDWPSYSSDRRLPAAAQRRPAQRRQPADVSDGRPAHLARAARRVSSGRATIPGRSRAIPAPPTSAWTACARAGASTSTGSTIAARLLDEVDAAATPARATGRGPPARPISSSWRSRSWRRAASPAPSRWTRSRPPCATAMAGIRSANRCCWRGGWCRRACRWCRRTWASCKTGTRTATTSARCKNSLLPPLDQGVSRPARRPRRDRACSTTRW